MNEKYIRSTIVYGNYFWEFYNSQKVEVQSKIDWVIGLVRTLPIIPEKFFKHLEGTKGLYEIRVKVGSDIFRIFCCFDKGNLIILFNGFQKKSNKAPKQEIEKAKKLKQHYYENKKEK
ncbi:MAG TPA: type II toxin-antitoxin system RelE/ParE family toxin [Bacteroidia bacterium]|nr:type II toxin-antitoxin system RelE/ParE family toxin [Bacteroidia bacterium]